MVVHPDSGMCEKGMSHQTVKRHGGTLDAYYWVKKASLQRLHVVWFQQYDVWKMQDYRD